MNNYSFCTLTLNAFYIRRFPSFMGLVPRGVFVTVDGQKNFALKLNCNSVRAWQLVGCRREDRA